MTSGFSEDHVEQASIEIFKSLGLLYLDGIANSSDGAAPERASLADSAPKCRTAQQ